MSSWCDFCMGHASILDGTDGALTNTRASMRLVRNTFRCDEAVYGFWRIDLMSDIGYALSVPVGFCPMCGREL